MGSQGVTTRRPAGLRPRRPRPGETSLNWPKDCDVVVDARGTFCPEPVIRTQNAAAKMPPGAVAMILADDAGIELDLPAWCISTRNEYLGVLREETLPEGLYPPLAHDGLGTNSRRRRLSVVVGNPIATLWVVPGGT